MATHKGKAGNVGLERILDFLAAQSGTARGPEVAAGMHSSGCGSTKHDAACACTAAQRSAPGPTHFHAAVAQYSGFTYSFRCLHWQYSGGRSAIPRSTASTNEAGPRW